MTPYLKAQYDKANNQGKPGYDVLGNPIATPKPVTAPGGSPTAGSIYSGIGVDPSLTAGYNTQIATAKTAADQPVDENAIRASTLASFQAEIDAQNALFADKLAQAKVTGADRLGSGTAIQARRGLIGSDFGSAQTDKINTANGEIYSGIENERNAKIQSILTQARTDASTAIKEKTAAKAAGLNDYVKYLGEAATRKTANATTAAQLLLNNGSKVEDLNANDLQALLSSYGISSTELKGAYTPLLKAAQKAKSEQDAKDLKSLDDHNIALSTVDKNKAKSALEEKQYNEDVRQFGLNYALDQKKAAIEAAKVAQTDPNAPAAVKKAEGDATNTINLVNTLLQSDSIDDITGFLQGKWGLDNLDPRSGTALAKNQYDQIKGLLSLENRSKLKGQGAVSDFEGRVLESAASSLSQGLNEADFRKQLKQIKGSISTSHGLTADVKITDPKTGESQTVNSNSQGIADAIKDGLIIEYQ